MAKLTVRQEKFMIALMNTNTIIEACKEANITNNTGHKYLNNTEFKQAYMKLRRETMQQATNKLQQSAVMAVETLENVMSDIDNSTPSARVQAARAVLDNAYKSLEIDDIQQRLDVLEEQQMRK